MVGWSKSLMNSTSRLEHPCYSTQPPACHGDGTPPRAGLSLATDSRGFDAAFFGDPGETRCLLPISATNELSTSTPETHQLSSTSLSTQKPPLSALAFPQHACAGFGHNVVRGGTG